MKISKRWLIFNDTFLGDYQFKLEELNFTLMQHSVPFPSIDLITSWTLCWDAQW